MAKLKFLIAIFLITSLRVTLADEKKFIDLPADKTVMLHYKSKIDNTSQPLLVKLPTNYSTDESWPLLVVLHGLGDGPILAPYIESCVQIGPYGRGDKWYREIGEKDVLESIEFAKTVIPIDVDRIYLTGFSMGGYGTFSLASRFPDIWAACVPVCPRIPKGFELENCSNLPFWIHTGKKDHRLPPEPIAALYEKSQHAGINNWLYTEHKNMGHSFDINWKDVEKWLLKYKRTSIPNEVAYTTDDPNATSAYWIEIKQSKNPQYPSSVKGNIEGKNINIIIDNVSSVKIDLSNYKKISALDIYEIIIKDGEKIVYSGNLPENDIFIYNINYTKAP